MGEIRSTLDIIMEKAKDVKVTDEEKKAFMRHEVEGMVRGLLQKYLDGVIKRERLRSEIETLSENRLEMARATLKKECLSHISPEGDNNPVFAVLEYVMKQDTAPLKKLLLKYEQDLKEERVSREQVLREQLKERGISGSAVVPNLEADPDWRVHLSETQGRFYREIVSLNTECR